MANKIIEYVHLETKTARTWEEKRIEANAVIFVRVDVADLKVKFNEKGSEEDEIRIPQVDVGQKPFVIQGDDNWIEKIFLNHSANPNGVLDYIITRNHVYYRGGNVVEELGHRYKDFKQLAFNADGGDEVSYTVGTAARTVTPTSWLSGIKAKRTRVYSTAGYAIRWTGASDVQSIYQANAYFIELINWTTLYVVGTGAAGTLNIWAEG